MFSTPCILLTWNVKPLADLQIFVHPANWHWKSSFIVVGSCCCCCSTKGFCLECTYLGNKLMGWPSCFMALACSYNFDFHVFKVIGVIVIIFIVTFLVAFVVTVKLIARQIPQKRGQKMNLWLLIVKTEPSDSLCLALVSFKIFFVTNLFIAVESSLILSSSKGWQIGHKRAWSAFDAL